MRSLAFILLLTASTTQAQSLEVAVRHMERGERATAYQVLRDLTDAGPVEDPHAFLFRGVLEREQGDLGAALRSFERGLENTPTHAALQLELATTQAWSGELDAALESYRAAVRQHPELTPARLGVARTLFWRGDHAEAAAAYNDVLRDEPESVDAQVGLADVRRVQLRRRSARSLYEQVLAVDADHEAARNGLRALRQDTHRAELRLSAGVAMAPNVATSPRGRLDLMVHATPRLRLFATAQQDVRTNKPAAARRSGGGLAAQFGALTLELGYQVQVSEDWRVHRLPLAASLALGKWQLMLSSRPGRRDDGRYEHLGSLGVQRSIGQGFVMARVFRGDHRDRHETAVALTGGWDSKHVSLRADAALTHGPATFAAFGAQVEWHVRSRHTLGVRGDYLSLGDRTLLSLHYRVRL